MRIRFLSVISLAPTIHSQSHYAEDQAPYSASSQIQVKGEEDYALMAKT
jgi:hypothetical protein